MAVQFCGTCGNPLIPDQLFCQHCGSRVDENATRSAPPVTPGITVSSPGMLYCGECGALVGPQDRVCRRCGAPVEPPAGGATDPSLSDLPTQMGTPPPSAFPAAPAVQATPAAQGTPAYPPPPNARGPQTPAPEFANQPPSAWAANYAPAPYDEAATYTFGSARPAVQAASQPPGGPGGPPSRRGPRWPLVVALVLIAIALIAGGGIFLALAKGGTTPQANKPTPTATTGMTPTAGITPTPSPTEVVLDPDTASALVEQFYADINAQDYDDAYNLLSPQWQQTQSKQNFIDGFQNTVKDTLTVLGAADQSDGTVKVNVTLQAENTDGTTDYAGYYLVIEENGQLLLLKGDLNPQ